MRCRFKSTPEISFYSLTSHQPDVISVLLHVEDVDRHFDHAKQFGVRVVKPPNNMPFGGRQYVAEDLAGHRRVFSQSISDVAPEQWGAKRVQPS